MTSLDRVVVSPTRVAWLATIAALALLTLGARGQDQDPWGTLGATAGGYAQWKADASR
jgi:hypothetical protein